MNNNNNNRKPKVEQIQDETEVISALSKNKEVMRYEFGDSMHPIFRSGEYALLKPIKSYTKIKQGDAVFCKIGDVYLTHLVWMVSNDYYLIGSSQGNLNGWVHRSKIFAIAHPTGRIKIEK